MALTPLGRCISRDLGALFARKPLLFDRESGILASFGMLPQTSNHLGLQAFNDI
jgi:hypothetical protein